MTDALQLDNDKQVLKQYYTGQRIDSPNGGFLMLLGIRPGDKGTALATFECSASSLRYEVTVPKATRTERSKIRDVLGAGEDPDCPRHGLGHRLVRAGKNLVCNECGIPYAKI